MSDRSKRRSIKPVLLSTVIMVAVGYLIYGEADRTVTDGAIEGSPYSTAGHLPRMVAFHAPYCAACLKMKPVVEHLSATCDKRGVFVETVDLSEEDNEAVAENFGVRVLPTYIFLNEQGFEQERLVGRQTAQTLAQALGNLRGQQCVLPKQDHNKGWS